MNEKVAPIPAGFTTITPHLLVKDAEEAFAFYQKAFGAKELSRQTHPSENWLLHLDLKIGNSILMLSGTSQGVDAFGNWLTPDKAQGTTAVLHLYVEDVDKTYERAIASGCEVKMKIMNAFWGDRYAQVLDPFGYIWSMASKIKKLTPEEIDEGNKKYFAKLSKK